MCSLIDQQDHINDNLGEEWDFPPPHRTLIQSIDIPQPNPLFSNLPQSDGGGDSDSDNEDEPINKDELFAVIDVGEDIDTPTELWETPGTKQPTDQINNIAHINPEWFKQGLKKPIARNPSQPEGENNT